MEQAPLLSLNVSPRVLYFQTDIKAQPKAGFVLVLLDV
jgi:hypothetical protein